MKFTVLMSVYYKEKPGFLKEALESIYNQTLLAEEVIVVEDGAISQELSNVLNLFEEENKNLKRVKLSQNVGLGLALREGVKSCDTNIIIRMDSDDVSRDNRFEVLIENYKKNPEYDVIGSYLSEYNLELSKKNNVKKVPLSHKEIEKKSCFRSPMNHPTVLIKKEALLDVGNYENAIYFEDYFLWLKMISKGKKMMNIPVDLYKMRCDKQVILRRSGFKYFKAEKKFFKKVYKLKYIGGKDYYKALFLRLPVRLFPKSIISFLYQLDRKKKMNY